MGQHDGSYSGRYEKEVGDVKRPCHSQMLESYLFAAGVEVDSEMSSVPLALGCCCLGLVGGASPCLDARD